MVGEGTCCLCQIEAGNTLRLLPTALSKRESQAFACHAWLLDGDAGAVPALEVGTKRGEVLVVADGEVRQALALEVGAGVESLAAHSKVGGAGAGAGCRGRRAGASKLPPSLQLLQGSTRLSHMCEPAAAVHSPLSFHPAAPAGFRGGHQQRRAVRL